jgi:hypothetical protein
MCLTTLLFLPFQKGLAVNTNNAGQVLYSPHFHSSMYSVSSYTM